MFMVEHLTMYPQLLVGIRLALLSLYAFSSTLPRFWSFFTFSSLFHEIF
jgi:hypothetical protein